MSRYRLDDQPVAGSVTSQQAWHRAWADTVHFVGDPLASLAESNAGDDRFAMGSVFCAAYRVLSGAPFDDADLVVDVQRVRDRAASEREARHAEAVEHLVAGDFSEAAAAWDSCPPGDFAAGRFAHDVYLHIGEVDRRVASSERTLAHFVTTTSAPYVQSQHAFSLEEAGAYDEAALLAWSALDADPMELWALHALAHVYESTDNQAAALDLLEGRSDTWTKQDGLAVHIHWHHALRLIAAEAYGRALDLFDHLVPMAKTPFRLCDLASLLWRLEARAWSNGQRYEVGDRWRIVADRFAQRAERHTCGFLDLHMAMAFERVPDHPEAARFFAGVAASHRDDASESGEIFRTVAAPLVEAIRRSTDEPQAAIELIDRVTESSHRIGGSIAQRDIISITRRDLATPKEPS